jgi:hypothetical protein
MQGCENAFALIRPPGHHAGRSGYTCGAPSCGFCLINNVCIGLSTLSLHLRVFTCVFVCVCVCICACVRVLHHRTVWAMVQARCTS